ncbi:MAG: FAD-dependent oxidoreductase [Xanthomonadales bacterium]|nr:FAD-dependent oxidoreductase [Gammaproteobacteria bacterium]MBT8052954.1 FAD-dependent oxidoreductase [Gammaproteobacteria bacterium]NND57846.1 FAD-dependent oxidoreductase [Xanthomonadales bacterium]NNK50726.1 FAD-dependent oxidoreductase [Xanthomonadales bacterium]
MTHKIDHFAFLDRSREDPDVYPLKVRKTEFREIYKPYDPDEAASQAERCLDCGNPYCEWKCPVHNYIPNWLKLAGEGRIMEAADLCHETNSLPEVCGRICPQDRLCEQACTLATGFGAVTIGAIERYIVDEALKQGWRPDLSHVQTKPWSVGIVGAGPAGLACADILTRNGISVTVYDRYPEIGGLLSFGIPDFKLELQVMRRRREVLEDAGVHFRLNCDIGRDIQASELENMHDALFFGLGTYKPVEASLPGMDEGGIVPALQYLIGQTAHLYGLDLPGYEHIDLAGEHVLVLGGGDTAMDCVRTAIRQGAATVHCVYRRDRENMPGSQREVGHAMKEGVRFEFNAQPQRLIHEKNRLSGVEIVKTRLVSSEQGRAVPEIIEGSEEVIPATAVIFAFGYRPSPPAWLEALGVNTAENGLVATDERLPGQTSNPAIFSAGDMVRGSDLVVTAIADAREAAQSIILHLESVQPQLKRA